VGKARFGKFILLAVAVCGVTFNISNFRDFFRFPLHENWRYAVQYIKKIPNYENEKMIFVFQSKYNPPVFGYYFWNDRVAGSFIDNIVTLEDYSKDLQAIDTKHKIYLMSERDEDGFFTKLKSFPDDAWIWVFRYHYYFYPLYMRLKNNGDYFFHQVPINPKIKQMDLFLLKKIKK